MLYLAYKQNAFYRINASFFIFWDNEEERKCCVSETKCWKLKRAIGHFESISLAEKSAAQNREKK